jgi:hypothetical protein
MRRSSPVRWAFALLLTFLSFAAADNTKKPPPPPVDIRTHITEQQRMDLIRALQAEVVYVKRILPISEAGAVIHPDGSVTPAETDIVKVAQKKGVAAKPGDKAKITKIELHDNKIVLEINGGPGKKTHWYNHVQIGMTGPSQTQPTAPGGPAGGGGSDPGTGRNPPVGPNGQPGGQPMPQPAPTTTTTTRDQPNNDSGVARGCIVTLDFVSYLPSLSVDQVKALLAPVFSFDSKSAGEALMDQMPPLLKNAIATHTVLVGMNREFVTYAKGRPQQRIRERDDKGEETEEWIYGQAPQDVEFVKFSGDEVVQDKIMKAGGEKIVKTQKEIDMRETFDATHRSPADATGGDQSPANQQAAGPRDPNSPDRGPRKPPTLRRPGEDAPEQRPQMPPVNPNVTPTNPTGAGTQTTPH